MNIFFVMNFCDGRNMFRSHKDSLRIRASTGNRDRETWKLLEPYVIFIR